MDPALPPQGFRPVFLASHSELENAAQNQTLLTENNQQAINIGVQQNMVPDGGQLISLSNNPQVMDPSNQGHALMVPVFENYHQAIRIRMAAGLNLPSRLVPEGEQQSGYNLPCLIGHPLALRPPLLTEYALPPHLFSDTVTQSNENNVSVIPSSSPPVMPENNHQSLFTHNAQPIAVSLPLSAENLPQLVPYRPPNLLNDNMRATPPRSPELDPRIPPRFVRLEGTHFSGLKSNSYRPRREGNKDFRNGSPDS